MYFRTSHRSKKSPKVLLFTAAFLYPILNIPGDLTQVFLVTEDTARYAHKRRILLKINRFYAYKIFLDCTTSPKSTFIWKLWITYSNKVSLFIKNCTFILHKRQWLIAKEITNVYTIYSSPFLCGLFQCLST